MKDGESSEMSEVVDNETNGDEIIVVIESGKSQGILLMSYMNAANN